MGQSNIRSAFQEHTIMIRSAATYYPSEADLPMKIAILYNEIAKVDYDIANDIPIEMLESENTAYGNEWRTY